MSTIKLVFASIILTVCVLSAYTQSPAHDSTTTSPARFTLLQWNIWQEGTMVEGGYEAIVDEIARLKPDFVTFSEVRNYKQSRFCDRIVTSLKSKGLGYYSFYSYDSGLLSRHPIIDSTTVYPHHDDHGSIYRLTSSINGRKVAVYTAHLDYLNCAYYNIRGYDGSTWKPIEIARDVAQILKINTDSYRDDAVRAFIGQAQLDIKQGYGVILGGDFNEPSHLDWLPENSHLYDHHGVVVPWTVTTLLENSGFVDSYRDLYPNVLTHPGFTYPSDNPACKIEKLTWAPEADERERIDYVFYHPLSGVYASQAVIYGPRGSIVRSRRQLEESEDIFMPPQALWPTDHKGLLVTFEFR